MSAKINRSFISRRAGVIFLAALGFALMLSGFGTASTFYWKKTSQTNPVEGITQSSPVTNALPGSFADLARQLSPMVVNVKVTKIEKTGNFSRSQIPDGPFGDFFRQFPNMMPDSQENRPVQGAGSGVIISKDGYILTNDHVIEGAKEVVVTLGEKKDFNARIVGRDPKTDLAVLKIETGDFLPVATLGDSEKLQVGDWVLAIGNPFGLSHTVTSGIVSAKGRVIGAGPYDNFIQTNASINPGNSGGPLFNMKGEVVGINTAIIPQGQGIGFAIPVNTVKPLVPQLVAEGKVTRGYLGINIQSMTPELAKAMKLKEEKGVLVAQVTAGSPAEKAGIQRGDVITSYNKKAVEEARDLSAMVAATPVGDQATITIVRNGKTQELTVKPTEMAAERAEGEPSIAPATGKWGLMFQDLPSQGAGRHGLKEGEGVGVAEVKSGSPADKAGLRAGDVIVEVNGQTVRSVKEMKETLGGSDTQDSLLLLVKRGEGSFYAALTA